MYNNGNDNNDVGLSAAIGLLTLINGLLGFVYGVFDYVSGGILLYGYPWLVHALFWAAVFVFAGVAVFVVVVVILSLFGLR